MAESQEKILAFGNQFHEFGTQIVEGTDCIVSPFPVITPTNNLVTLELTQGQLLELLSSVQVGAEWVYPDKSQQILFNFMKGLVCPPILEEQDCFEYKTFASFIKFDPVNPYIEPDTIPDGYLSPPFILNTDDGVPVPNYAKFDVLVPFDSLTLDVDWLDDIGGQLPQVRVIVEGEGQVFLRLLNQVAGGLAVITVDNPPNILDIIGGVLTGAENIIDLNLDIVSLPPETAEEIIFPVSVTGTGLHTIYIVFLPILDDSLLPIRFGGGFRGVQLCDFVEQPEMGIQDIRFNDATCNLETLVDGEWEVVSGWENWLDCVPTGGGGGGGTSLAVTTYGIDFANQDTTSTSMVKAVGTAISHAFTKSKALIIAEFMVFNNSASNTYAEIRVDSNQSTPANPSRRLFNSNTTVVNTGNFEGIELGSQEVAIFFSAQSGTARIVGAARCVYTIIEYENAEDLFVEDIRILDGELQKKIGGAWIPVSESLADLLDTIAAAAAAAQADADTALAQNIAQQTQINAAVTVNNLQNTRLDDLEEWQTDAELSIAGLNAQVILLDGRVDALEAAAVNNSYWSETFNFAIDDGGFVALNGETYAAGQGWQSENGLGTLEIRLPSLFAGDGRITHMKLRLRADNALGALPNTYQIAFPYDGGEGNGYVAATGTTQNFWYKVENLPENYLYTIKISMRTGAIDYTLREVQFLGKGDNPF